MHALVKRRKVDIDGFFGNFHHFGINILEKKYSVPNSLFF